MLRFRDVISKRSTIQALASKRCVEARFTTPAGSVEVAPAPNVAVLLNSS